MHPEPSGDLDPRQSRRRIAGAFATGIVARTTAAVVGVTGRHLSACLVVAGGLATAQARSDASHAPSNVRRFEGLPFTSVRQELPGELELSHGRTNLVTVEAEQAVLEALRIRVQAGELQLAADGFQTRKPLRVRVEFAALERLTLAGSGDTVLGSLRTHRLHLRVQGSGDLSAYGLNLSELGLDSSGSGQTRLSGEAREARFRLTGSGDVDASSFKIDRAELVSTGSADASVRVVRSLEATLEGSGSVRCTGRPRVTRRGSGSGEVECSA